MKCKHFTCHQCSDEESKELKLKFNTAINLLQEIIVVNWKNYAIMHPSYVAKVVEFLKETDK